MIQDVVFVWNNFAWFKKFSIANKPPKWIEKAIYILAWIINTAIIT